MKTKIAQKTDKLSETTSVRSHDSRRSHASHASTSSSVARLKAAAEAAAAAKEQAEYERLLVEKENKMKQREAEEEKHRQQVHTQHERDISHFIYRNACVLVHVSRVTHFTYFHPKCNAYLDIAG